MSAAAPPTATAPAPTARQARLRLTGLHMAVAMGVLVLPLVLLVAMCQPGARQVPTVDTSRTFKAAAAEADFAVQHPRDLPGFRATQASLNRHAGGTLTVRVTYFTPGDRSVQFVQSDRAAVDVLESGLDGSDPAGSEMIADGEWQVYTLDGSGDRAYVQLTSGRTMYLAGNANEQEFRDFIAALRR